MKSAAAHLAVILGLALLAAVRYWGLVSVPGPATDEGVYLRAFEDVAGGRSPYYAAGDDLDFYYPPPFAYFGGFVLEAFGKPAVLTLMRSANLLGLGVCLWFSFLFTPLARRWRFALAGLYILLGPLAITTGLGAGNLSLAAVGACLAALAAWSMSAPVSGVLFGLSAVLKPVAPVGILALGAHQPEAGGRSHLWAAAIGLVVGGTLALASPYLWDYLALSPGEVDEWPLRRSVSLYRWLRILGFGGSPVVLLALVSAGTLWIARRARLSARQLSVLAIVGMTLATPALWAHTLMLTLPLQVMAAARAWKRLRSDDPATAYRARYELVFVTLAILALQAVNGIGGGVEVSTPVVQVPVLAVPVFAPLALGMYSWREAPLNA